MPGYSNEKLSRLFLIRREEERRNLLEFDDSFNQDYCADDIFVLEGDSEDGEALARSCRTWNRLKRTDTSENV